MVRSASPYFAIDELGILRALGIAVSGAVSRASFIVGILRLATICCHIHEVGRPICTARPAVSSVKQQLEKMRGDSGAYSPDTSTSNDIS